MIFGYVLVYWPLKRAGLLMSRLLKTGGIWMSLCSLVDMYAKFGNMEDANRAFT
jgi:hypothetical protein